MKAKRIKRAAIIAARMAKTMPRGTPDFIVNFDGSCWPNPGGTPTYAWSITTVDGIELDCGTGEADDIYPKTNNTAEFSGMLAAIEAGTAHAKGAVVLVRGDSQLAINAIRKAWDMKQSPHLAELAGKAWSMVESYAGSVYFEWVPREHNQRADALAGFAGVRS